MGRVSKAYSNSLLYSGNTHILPERFRVLTEACGFLHQELQFGRKLIENGSHDNEAFYPILQQRLVHFEHICKRLSEFVDYAFFHPRPGNSPSIEMAWVVRWIEESLGELSRAMQDVANERALRLFRNPSGISQFQNHYRPSLVRLSEAHLDYADTFRAVSYLVRDYFEPIRKGFLSGGNYGHITPPIVTLSRNEEVCWESFSVDGYVPLFVFEQRVEDLLQQWEGSWPDIVKLQRDTNIRNPEDLRSYFRHATGLSRVVAPRYFPVMLRYSPLLAHELSHAVLVFISVIQETWARHFAMWSESLISEEFGSNMLQLLGLHERLSKTIFSHLEPLHGTHFSLPECVDKFVDMSFLRAQSQRYGEELACDIAGLMIGGPSYLYATVCYAGLSTSCYYDYKVLPDGTNHVIVDVTSTHPPGAVRIMVLKFLAEAMGYKIACSRVDQMLKRMSRGGGGKYDNYYRRVETYWRDRWFEKCKGKEAVLDLAKFLQDCLVPSQLAVRSEFKGRGSTGLRRYRDARMHSVFSAISAEVASGHVDWSGGRTLEDVVGGCSRGPLSYYKGVQLTTIDVINAQWNSEFEPRHPENTRRRLNWKLALCKSFGETNDKCGD